MPNVFDNSRQVLINGKVVDSIVTSTGGVLYSRLLSSSLSIDVPLNLVYSDAFLINGTLTDKNNEGIVGETVKLVVGSTVVDSTTTTTNGAYSFTQTPVSTGNHTFQVVYDGSEKYSESESSIVERVVGKETIILSLTTPTDNSSVYTDDSINVNGSLVTDDNEKLNNKTIVVKEGNTIITTYTTNSNGVFTGSITGLNAGTHSLTFQFVSDSNYTGSSVVRTVIVNNHSYNLSANVDQSAILLNDSVTISGVLLKDGNGYANQTVTIYDGTTNKGICTTDSNGEYSKTLTGLTAGTHTFKAVNTNVESSTVSVTVSEPTPVHNYTLSVTGTAIIQTGDTDNITATLKDNGVVVSGETLNYQIKHGSTVIDSGSDTTDSNGEISISYTGTGVGDVDVIVSYGSLLQETYVVQDYISAYADTDSTKWTTNGASGLTINSNGLTLANSNWKNVTLTQALTQGISIEYKITALSGSANGKLYYVFYDSGDAGGHFKTNALVWGSTTSSYTMTNAVIRFEIANNTIKIYLDDVLKVTDSWSVNSFHMGFSNGSNRSGTIKDLIIKAL